MPSNAFFFRPLPSASLLAAGLLLAGVASGLLGCAGDGSRPAVSSSARRGIAERTSDGLELAKSTKRSVLWVKPDHHLGRYDEVIVQVAGFLYADGQSPLSADEEKQVGEMLASTLAGITTDSPVRQTRTPGPCAVVVNVGLKDLRLHTSEQSGSSTSFVSSFGSVTLVVEFRDSMTDAPLLRFMAARGLGGGPGTGQAGANLPRLGKTLGEIATEMVDELAVIVPSTTSKQAHECKDGIYALTGRG
ncbi:MAG: DUF3313 family protein [Myxococcota bacterium]